MSEKEVELEEVFTHILAFLAYEVITLIHVKAGERAGQDVFPVVIACKAPILSRQNVCGGWGISERGRHNLKQLGRGGGRSLEVSPEAEPR